VLDVASGTCVCPTGTYDASTATSSACLSCNTNCNNCTVSVCYSCSQGYYPVGASCLACIDNCQTCKIGSTCEVCKAGYSLAASGLCFSSGGGNSGTLAADGSTIVLCESGCEICIASSTSTTGSICTTASSGYSIVGGIVLKCHPSCLTCASYLNTICTSCYPGSVLKSGTCVACGDSNALTCSSLDINYALTCKVGYTAGAYSASSVTGGTCRACSLYCTSCLVNGPGNCDSNGCIKGTVQVSGSTNCTKCFNGCVTCLASNPNSCLDCGNQRYLTSTSSCASCPTGCRTCTSATVCQSCIVGY
jgi:proprotein convertase subtilisin/kexin type 5